jgi:hypothetical protein
MLLAKDLRIAMDGKTSYQHKMARPVWTGSVADTTTTTTPPPRPKVAWRRACFGLWRRLRALVGVRGDRKQDDSDDVFKFFNGSNNTMETTALDEDSEEEVFTEERVVRCPKWQRCVSSADEQRQAWPHENASDLRDIYSLIDTILAEQYDESARHCASRHTTARVHRSTRAIPSLPSAGSVASSSVCTANTPFCIFDDASVDTFHWRKDRTAKRAAEPLPKQRRRRAVRSSSIHEKRVWSEEDCPWETNWAEFTLRSDESVESALLLNSDAAMACGWPMPLPILHATTYSPNPNPMDASYASRLYVTWKPKCHRVEV